MLQVLIKYYLCCVIISDLLLYSIITNHPRMFIIIVLINVLVIVADFYRSMHISLYNLVNIILHIDLINNGRTLSQ